MTQIPGLGADLRNWRNLLVIALFVALAFVIFGGKQSADLQALFLASSNFANGNFSAIYPDPGHVFNLSVPHQWEEQATQAGITERPLFPYIYPPLWAALFSPLSQLVDATTFDVAATFFNAALLGFCAILSYRIIRPRISLVVWIAASLLIVVSTSTGYLALVQNQPQILVSFLILLGIERDRSKSPIAAGIAMALAASIKLYPVLFVIFWMASRNYRAFVGFVIAGALLGGTSIALAGWPLHAQFLDQIKVIAGSFVTSDINLNLDSVLAQWILWDHLQQLHLARLADPGAVGNLIFAPKPHYIRALDQALMLVLLASLFRLVQAADDERRFCAIYPAGIAMVALLSPLTWTYHYIPVIFLLPTLLRHGITGWIALAAIILALNEFVLLWVSNLPFALQIGQLLGTFAVVLAVVMFLKPMAIAKESP